jgi:hypothetical protein
MGSSVEAICECGYSTSTLIGGGMMSFQTTCYFPCLCEHCRNIVPVNLLAPEPRCPQCDATKIKPYDDPRLAESRGQEIVAEWNMGGEQGRTLTLTDGAYLCPRCNRVALRFTDGGLCWD